MNAIYTQELRCFVGAGVFVDKQIFAPKNTFFRNFVWGSWTLFDLFGLAFQRS
jgi:hypothetical protein